LVKKLPDSHRADKNGPPSVIQVIKKCEKYGVSHGIMCELNYTDLLALVIEYDIETVQEHLRMLEQQRRAKNGFASVREASNEDILRMHGKKVS
jgi:hypothetical protein